MSVIAERLRTSGELSCKSDKRWVRIKNCQIEQGLRNNDIIGCPQTAHKKTFFYLEQLILKYHAHNHALRIKESHDGIDFFYAGKQEARKMVDFLQTVVPCRYVK
jgi:uncharacterized protein YbaR (Trm112 family)